VTPLNSCGHRVTWPVPWALHYIRCSHGAGLGISSCRTQTDREQALELFLRIHSDIASWMGTIAGNTISTCHLGDPESISVTGESRAHPFMFTERSTMAWGSQEWISRSHIHQSTNTIFSPIFFFLLASIPHRIEMKGRVLSLGLVCLFDQKSSLGPASVYFFKQRIVWIKYAQHIKVPS